MFAECYTPVSHGLAYVSENSCSRDKMGTNNAVWNEGLCVLHVPCWAHPLEQARSVFLLLVLSPSGRTQHVCFPAPSYAKVKTHPLLADQIDSPSSMVPWSSVRFLGSHCHHRMPGLQERKEFFHFVTDMCWFHLTGAVSKCSRNMKMKCSKKPTASLLTLPGGFFLFSISLASSSKFACPGSPCSLVIEAGYLDSDFIVSLECHSWSNWTLTAAFSLRAQLACLWITGVTPFTISHRIKDHLIPPKNCSLCFRNNFVWNISYILKYFYQHLEVEGSSLESHVKCLLCCACLS